MSESPIPDLPAATVEQPTNTCGACKYGCAVALDFKQPLECRRYPPTLTTFLAPRAGGQMELMNQTQYPRVARLAAACGEWVPRFGKQN